jgi:dihydroneopterin aldolase
VNTSWTVRVERLEIQLPVGIYADEVEPQPVWVSLTATGMAPASPNSLDQCFDYEPLCRWLLDEWPRTPHTPLLEARINQLLAFLFDLDARVQTVWVGLYKQRMSRNAVAVGIERQTTRVEFDAQQRAAAADSIRRTTEPSVL